MNQKGIAPIIIILIVIGILAVGGGIYLWQKQKTAPSPVTTQENPPIVSDVKDENPDEVVSKLVTAEFLNDFSYLKEHTYCDNNCGIVLKNELDMSFKEVLNLDQKSTYEEKAIIHNLDITVASKTKNEANYNATINFTSGALTTTVTIPYRLIKIDHKWMKDMNDELKLGAIPLWKNYKKIFADINRCRKAGPIEFNIPKNGGVFSISDKSHPLYGFSIRIPKLKEEMEIKVSCRSDFFPIALGAIFVSLPISIETNKVLSALLYEENFYPGIAVSIEKIEKDKTFAGKWPLIQIPYYDTAFSVFGNKKPLFATIVTSNDEPEKIERKNVINGEFNTANKIAKGYFVDFYKTWAVIIDGLNFGEF